MCYNSVQGGDLMKKILAFSGATELPLKTTTGDNIYVSAGAIAACRKLECESRKYLDIDLPENIAKKVVLIDGYHSATIEGARTTLEKVTEIAKHHNQITSKSDRMVLNSIKAMQMLCAESFNQQVFKEAWKIIVDGVCENTNAGVDGYRTGMVYIGSADRITHVPEIPENIESRMNDLFMFMNERDDILFRSLVFHFYCAYIHPFCDGNGRIARAASSAYLYHRFSRAFGNIPISKAINESLSGYYRALYDSENLIDDEIDITPFILYMNDRYLEAMKQYSLYGKQLTDKESIVMTKMLKNGKGTVSVEKCAKMLKCTQPEALGILNDMLEKGFLSFHSGEYRIGWREK